MCKLLCAAFVAGITLRSTDIVPHWPMLAVSAWGCGAHGVVCESRGTLSDSNAGISAVTSTEGAALVGEQQRVAGFIRRFADIMYGQC